MFFVLSKTLGRLAEPTNLALSVICLALLLGRLKRAARLRRTCWAIGIGILVLFSTGAVASGLLCPLERVYQRPRLGQPPAAIVVLGGMLELDKQRTSPFELSGAADRFVEGLRLAHRYPEAELVISGGSSALVRSTDREAAVLGRLARDLGVAPERITLEDQSRNTRENAVFTVARLRNLPGPILLITSAAHMVRAVACFAKAGRKVVPWPVDYQRESLARVDSWIPTPTAMQKSTAALREYLGLLAYRVAGYI